jgi:hypothetical protein
LREIIPREATIGAWETRTTFHGIHAMQRERSGTGKREGRRVTAVRCAVDPDSYIVATRIGCCSESAIARTDGLRRTCSESSESIVDLNAQSRT